MHAEQIQKLQRREPFRPYSVQLANGRIFSVNHPECAMLSPTKRTLFVHGDSNYGEGDVVEALDVALITNVFYAEN